MRFLVPHWPLIDMYTIQQFRNKNVLDPALEEVEGDVAELELKLDKVNFTSTF